jgi:hypothetical protein
VTNNTAQPTFHGDSTAPVAFDVEDYDTNNLHSNTTNNTRLVAPLTGIYQLSGGICYSPNSTGVRVVEIVKNNPPVGEFANGEELAQNHGASNGSITWPTCMAIATTAKLQAGDYVELFGAAPHQLSVAIIPWGDQPNFEMTWIAPGS